MDRGYVRLWRKSLDSAVFTDPILWKLWCLCLMKANFKNRWVSVDGIALPIELKSGQFITGRIALHKEFYLRAKRHSQQVSPLTLWRKLEVLQDLSNLNIRSHAKYSIISISNWNDYQKVEQPVNNRRTTGEQPVNTDNNYSIKELKETPLYPPPCEKFWLAYPKKVGKGAALNSWKKIKPSNGTVEKIIGAVEYQKKDHQWSRDGGRFIPNPATWLNQRRWDDEGCTVPEQAARPPQESLEDLFK